MVSKVHLYVEGGGDTEVAQTRCRRGFRELLEKAGFKNRMPAITACGSRSAAYDNFKAALKAAQRKNAFPVLLVDSEAPLPDPDLGAWEHLETQAGFEPPAAARPDQAQLMVACMETWLMADHAALHKFFGPGFNPNALLSEVDLEARPCHAVQRALEEASRHCGRDRKYRKGERSFDALSAVEPETLKKHLPHFKKFVDDLDKHL